MLTICFPHCLREDPENPSTRGGDLQVGRQKEKQLLPPPELPAARSPRLKLNGRGTMGLRVLAQVTVSGLSGPHRAWHPRRAPLGLCFRRRPCPPAARTLARSLGNKGILQKQQRGACYLKSTIRIDAKGTLFCSTFETTLWTRGAGGGASCSGPGRDRDPGVPDRVPDGLPARSRLVPLPVSLPLSPCVSHD